MRTSKKQREAERLAFLELSCINWNKQYPAGTKVKYHPVIGEPDGEIFETRGDATVLSGHTAVVWLKGKAGCVCLEACEPLSAEANHA